jgi:hypothetical protein
VIFVFYTLFRRLWNKRTRRTSFAFTVRRGFTIDPADALGRGFWCITHTVSTGWHIVFILAGKEIEVLLKKRDKKIIRNIYRAIS